MKGLGCLGIAIVIAGMGVLMGCMALYVVQAALAAESVRISPAPGAGIAPENIGKVFEAFFTTKSLGSGLGLNIASQIIANHKGSIYVESQLGVGSTFFINFPLISH